MLEAGPAAAGRHKLPLRYTCADVAGRRKAGGPPGPGGLGIPAAVPPPRQPLTAWKRAALRTLRAARMRPTLAHGAGALASAVVLVQAPRPLLNVRAATPCTDVTAVRVRATHGAAAGRAVARCAAAVTKGGSTRLRAQPRLAGSATVTPATRTQEALAACARQTGGPSFGAGTWTTLRCTMHQATCTRSSATYGASDKAESMRLT